MDGTPPKSLSRSLLFLWLPVVVWAGFIFWLSSQSEPPKPPAVSQLPGWSSLAHFGLYFILGALLYRGFRGRGLGLLDGRRTGHGAGAGMSPAAAYLLSLAAGALYGASDELHQHFVPSRQMDPVDWMVDVGGVLAGALALILWHLRRNKY